VSEAEGTDLVNAIEIFEFNNISLGINELIDTTEPTVSIFSPVDGAAGVTVITNLVFPYLKIIKLKNRIC
jgi:hypothetical protein